jgi:hypothetical protein
MEIFPKKNMIGWNGGWMMDGWWMKNMDEPFGCKFHFLDEVFGWLMGQL